MVRLLAALLMLALVGPLWAEGSGISRSARVLEFTNSGVVTGDEDQFSQTVTLREGVFNAISVTLKLESAGSPNIIPRIQLLSPIDNMTWTENHPRPIPTENSVALTATGTYIFDIQIPLVQKMRIRLDGEAGGAATTVSGVVLVQ
jgi:hypothetical protein